MAGIKEVWINDRGTFRRIQRFYERQGRQWVEISADEAIESASRFRRRQALMWIGVAILIAIAGVSRALFA